MDDRNDPKPKLQRPAVKQEEAAPRQQSQLQPNPPPPPGDRNRAEEPRPPTFSSPGEMEARAISELAIPARLKIILNDLGFGELGVKTYLDALLKRAVSTTDPIEVMIIQQLALVHHRLAQLHQEASHAKTMEGIKVLNAAASRLTGEFRRTVLSLRAYRAPVASKSVSFIKMQAVAEHQDVRFVDGSGQGTTSDDSKERIVLAERGKLKGNAFQGAEDGSDKHPETQVIRPGSRRQDQRQQAAAMDG
jgi:hypothetical protein